MMKDLASQLKYRAILYEPTDVENDMEEVDSALRECERFYCGIVPANGRVDMSLPGEVTAEEVTHKITIRMKASKRLRQPGGRQHTRMLIDGIWYDVLYVLPQYKTRDHMVIYAKMRAE